ncbi:MAG: M20 family metallopeptidase [Microbacteriaceae bacterium]
MPEARLALDRAVQERADRAVRTSLELHARPELALREHYACELLTTWLQDEGFAVERGVAGLDTAFVGRWGDGGPTIALMAEYDALPGIGHACGHNLIAAGGVLVASAVRAVLAARGLPGTVLLIGTPGEEGAGGKITELEAGVFDGVDAALMFHPSDRTVLTRRMLACLHLDIRFHGVAAHAAKNPDQGRNALAAMIQFFSGVDALRQHIPASARLHGIITNGGTAPNVVPDLTEAAYIVRDVTLDSAVALRERIVTVAEGAAAMTGTRAEVLDSVAPYAHLRSNLTMAARLERHLGEIGLEVVPPSPEEGTASTDAGNVSLALPTVHPFVGIAPLGTPGHSEAFARAAASPQAQQAMLGIASGLARTAWDLLTDPALLLAARDEFAHTAA